MIPAVIAAVVLAVAGHPVTVSCDADTNSGGIVLPAEGHLEGWAPLGGSEIHLTELRCAGLAQGPASFQFPVAFGTLVHEAAHARGVAAEDCAELWADLASFDLLQRFYGVPMFSARSWEIGAAILAHTRTKTADYQPGPSSCAR